MGLAYLPQASPGRSVVGSLPGGLDAGTRVVDDIDDIYPGLLLDLMETVESSSHCVSATAVQRNAPSAMIHVCFTWKGRDDPDPRIRTPVNPGLSGRDLSLVCMHDVLVHKSTDSG
jgi:hypothetical protein